MNDDKKQPFLSHLEELRERFIKCFIAVGIRMRHSIYIFRGSVQHIVMAFEEAPSTR